MRKISITTQVRVDNLMAEADKWSGIFLEGGTRQHPHEYPEAVIYYGRAIVALAAIKNGVDKRSFAYDESVRKMDELRAVYNQRYPSRVHLGRRKGGFCLVQENAYRDESGAWRTAFLHKRIRDLSDLHW